MKTKKILLFANTDWFLYNFRRSLAERLLKEGWQVILVSPSGDYGRRLQALGFHWLPLDFSTGGTNPFAEMYALYRLITLYRKEKPNIAHHSTIKCVLYGSLAARVAGKVCIVNSVTGLGHIFIDHGLKAKLLRPFVKIMYQFVLGTEYNRVVFENQEDQYFFTSTGLVNLDFTRLIRGAGVNCEVFSPVQRQLMKSDGRVKILFASRMLREKGVIELLAAARSILSSGSNAEFIFAGDIYPGNPSSLTENEISDIKAEGIVTYLGHVNDMPALLAQADIVVLPSYREGTPRILIEAAAMAIPIVATDIAGCRGLVQDEINGLLVPVRNAKALAAALQRLIADRELRQLMGTAGREIVLAEFDEEIVLEKTFAVYKELLEDQ